MTKAYDTLNPKTLADAVMTKQAAQRIRQKVEDCPDHNPHFNKTDLERAECMDAEANAILALPEGTERGLGGELIPPPEQGKMGLTLTLQKPPDRLNLEASISRAALADDSGVMIEAIDCAESLDAKDAAEQMLAHQLPTLHRAAMEMMQRAGNTPDVDRACKLANTAARLFETYGKAMSTLSNYRRGGAQVVRHVHQYVQVQDGGKAIVTVGTEPKGDE